MSIIPFVTTRKGPAKLADLDVAAPMALADAKALAKSILATGKTSFVGHALDKMAERNMHRGDVSNVIRAGRVSGPEWENGQWRYRFETQNMTAIVVFRSTTSLTVVTAWRNR